MCGVDEILGFSGENDKHIKCQIEFDTNEQNKPLLKLERDRKNKQHA